MPVESNELEEITKAQAQKAPEQPTVRVQRLDLPSLAETFADSIDLAFFDGQPYESISA